MKVKIGDIDFNLLVKGAASNNAAIVFLHYFGGSSESWREVIEHLEKDHRCIAPDLRGFGQTVGGRSCTIEEYVQDIIDLINALDLKNYILVGHSMGGKLALAAAAQKLEKLNSLILIAPSPPTPEPMAENERQRLLKTHGTSAAAEVTIKTGVCRPLLDEVFRQAIKDNLESDDDAWKAWLEVGSRRDISSAVEKISIPVFAAVGSEDENMTAELVNREIVSRISGTELSVIGNAKHLLPLEAPLEVAEFIRQAVERTFNRENKV